MKKYTLILAFLLLNSSFASKNPLESYTIKVEGDTLTISPVDFPMELVFERVSE